MNVNSVHLATSTMYPTLVKDRFRGVERALKPLRVFLEASMAAASQVRRKRKVKYCTEKKKRANKAIGRISRGGLRRPNFIFLADSCSKSLKSFGQ